MKASGLPLLILLWVLLCACAPATATPTLAATAATALKPADADTPAAGICLEPLEDPVRIVLGSGNDGLPLAGRCMIIHPQQRILLVNGIEVALIFDFAQFTIDLAPGAEQLLEKPAGEFLASGVHFLPQGPEIWVK